MCPAPGHFSIRTQARQVSVTALRHGEWTQVCVSCFFSPSPRCVWQQCLSPIIPPPAPTSAQLVPADGRQRSADKRGMRRVLSQLDAKPPDMDRVTSLGQAGAPHQPSPGGAADISSVMAPTTFCASSGPSTSLLSVRFPGKFCVKRQSRGGRVYTITVSTRSPPGQGREHPREGTASSKVTGKRAVP